MTDRNIRDIQKELARVSADYNKIMSNYRAIAKLVSDNDKLTKLVNRKIHFLEKYLKIIFYNDEYHKKL